MAKLDRALQLVHLLAESGDGLTLDEMARNLGVDRRTAERLRDIVRVHFDLEEWTEDRHKRHRIRDSLRRAYTRPTAGEIAALQTVVDAQARRSEPQAVLLSSLLAKVKAALDDREKRRLDPDLEPLVRLQRNRVPAGPWIEIAEDTLGVIQSAILGGCCVEFEYQADGVDAPQWRRIVPYGLLHGPITYLVGRIPGDTRDPITFRLDRMQDVRVSELAGLPEDGWDLDAWLARSFGIWREDDHDIVLRVSPDAADRARRWRFHPEQQIEEVGDGLLIRFRAGGLWELADHIFTWSGDIVIVEPQALRDMLHERLEMAAFSLGRAPSKGSPA